MNRDWESVFSTWAQGPKATEQTRAENAEKMVKSAVENSPKLQSRNIRVFTQGSYRNRVNVRKDSDVDVGILCFDTYFTDYPDDNVKIFLEKMEEPATYTYATFKDEIEVALVAKFGRLNVMRGSKSFDIHENTYHVEADVAAFFEHRRYTSNTKYLSGVEMIPDDRKPARIRNWPEQHYENGVAKNSRTSRRYKRMVRILKTLSNEMSAQDSRSADKAPSFLIECLVWNAPDEMFSASSYRAMVRSVLTRLFNNTINDDECNEWGEVSELKYLFRRSQPWARSNAHAFLSDAWDYIGFE